MTESSLSPDTSETKVDAPPRRPMWVKILLLVLAALIVLFIVMKLTGGGGQHGPNRHMGMAPIALSAVAG